MRIDVWLQEVQLGNSATGRCSPLCVAIKSNAKWRWLVSSRIAWIQGNSVTAACHESNLATPKLGQWVTNQRHSYKLYSEEGKPSAQQRSAFESSRVLNSSLRNPQLLYCLSNLIKIQFVKLKQIFFSTETVPLFGVIQQPRAWSAWDVVACLLRRWWGDGRTNK